MGATATDKELFDCFERLGISVRLARHPVVRTIEESKRLRGDLPGGHVKNLLLRNKRGELWLLCALEDTRVDLRRLGEMLNSGRLSFANAEQLESALGVTAGAVSPLAIINDADGRVCVVLEERMLGCNLLNFHPLRNDATVTMSSADLLRFLDACRHEPARVSLG